MIELETNGDTQRFIELTEQEIHRLITSDKACKFYRFFSQYVLLQADAFLMQHNPQAAIQSINHINLQDLQIYTGKMLADKLNASPYSSEIKSSMIRLISSGLSVLELCPASSIQWMGMPEFLCHALL